MTFQKRKKKQNRKHIVQELGTEEENWVQKELWEKLYMEKFYRTFVMVVAWLKIYQNSLSWPLKNEFFCASYIC